MKTPISSWQYGIKYKKLITDKQFWHLDGKLHRLDGPTVIYYPLNVKEWWIGGVQFTEQGKDRLCNNPLLPSYSFCVNENYYQIKYGLIKGVEFSIDNKQVTEQEFKNRITLNYK